MRYGDKLRYLAAGFAGSHQRLDDRCEIGAAVGKHVADSLVKKGGKIRFGDGLADLRGGIHGETPTAKVYRRVYLLS